jgi:MoaA/NifB/PqqE/SkfB family radical SAM enzyme/GT2 family glycosyltransferase
VIPAQTPRILWVELTSKCPLDCVFCSRKTRRGAGEHMPYDLFESLVGQVHDPRTFLLNYSGESTVYPELLPAIRLARSTGAFVELVSALVNVAEPTLAALCESGLSRLTVSVHTTDPEHYQQIYRYGSMQALRKKLARFVALSRERPIPPKVDLAFVAMDSNLQDLRGVAGLAESLGLREINIFPVMRRDEIPVQFPSELGDSQVYSGEFRERVMSTVARATNEFPAVSLTICNPEFSAGNPVLGEVPIPYPRLLPDGARIHSCEQNPWETTHVLSNGDVVACEVLDKVPLGNLQRQSLAQIWQGDAYRTFRDLYQSGEVPECRACPWKRAYRPGPIQSDVVASRGLSAQLLHGWHPPSGEEHIWSSQQALAVIAPRKNSRVLHVSGRLPPGPEGDPNELVISCNQTEIGRVSNPWQEVMPFGLDFEVPAFDQAAQAQPSWFVEFRTRHVYRPSERNASEDHRDLGFALFLLTSKAWVDFEAVERRRKALEALPRVLGRIDRVGRAAGHWLRRSRVCPSRPLAPGLTVLIPERDNASELAECLASVQEAAAQWPEPMETIVVVNGSPAPDYNELQARDRDVQWRFSQRPLGFCGAVASGLRHAHFDWVYLLNSDVVLDPAALAEAGRHRNPAIFSIASHILLKDRTRFPEETNWTTLFVEDGLATIHDRIPEMDETVGGFYSGGGASMFQTRLLRRFARISAYQPFYWEDVEWGWRARKLGFHSLFCPGSIAHHTQRSTIRRHYGAAEIERVTERNRLLFQLRNFTSAGCLKRLCDHAASSPHDLADDLVRFSTLWSIACGRIWNHRTAISDEEVLSKWSSPTSR